jgi:hypothetical protein
MTGSRDLRPLPRRTDQQDSPARRFGLPPAGQGDQRRAASRLAGLRPAYAPTEDHAPGPGPAPDRPGRMLGDRAYDVVRSAPTCGAAASRPPSPSPRTRPVTGAGAAAAVAAHPPSANRPTSSATPSSAPSANSASTAPSPPGTTNATTSGAALSMWPQSGSGSAAPSHDLRDTPIPSCSRWLRATGRQAGPGGHLDVGSRNKH